MKNGFAALARSRRPLFLLGVVLLLLAAAFGAIEATRISLERDYRETLDDEAKRRATEVMAQTLNGNVMGSVAALGLVNKPIKRVARGEIPLQDPEVMETLQAVGKAYQANGAYVVNSTGIIQSCWYTMGVTLTGVDIKFRPYFQIAMQGKQNIYAAIGTTTGKRSLYFAAPLYGDMSASSPVIGATVARLDLERVDSVLKAWPGLALLLSPQQVTYASNREDWVEQLAGEKTPEQLQAIRSLKQFGHTFDTGTPKILPFAIDRDVVSVDGRRYAVARAPVQWNDPKGEWTLVLLGGLDELMPPSFQAKIAAATSALVLIVSGLFAFWRRRLHRSEGLRRQAEAELNDYTRKLEAESTLKSNLAQISTVLQQTGSIDEFAGKFLFHAIPLLGVEYGVFYVLDEETRRLVPVGGHGVATKEIGDVAIGQGLVGECARDKKSIVIASAHGSDIRIVWGVGAVMPKAIILQPVMQTGRLLGVIELAALHSFGEGKQVMLETLTAMVAMNLEILMRNLGTRRQAEVLQRQQIHLQETETWYRGIIESAPDGMLVMDERGTIILANSQLEAIFGYPRGELIGQLVEILVPPPERSRHVVLREDFVKEGKARAMGAATKELHAVRQDGSEFPIEVSLSMLPALGEHGVCVCATVRDITQRRKDEEALRTSQQQMHALKELERFNQLAIGREQRIIELKQQINALAAELGRPTVFAAPEITEQMEVAAMTPGAEPMHTDELEIINLDGLVDLDKLQSLFTNFCESVGVASAIIDLEGRVLVSSHWQRACTDFHRVNQATCARCIESDTDLALKLDEGKDFTMYKCKNGMTDCASPIIVEGRHLANVFIGQFHVGPPDMAFFRKQAQDFGFPQDDYLKAIAEAPVLDEKKLPLILGFLTGFTKMVTSLSIERLRADVAQRTLQLRADELFKQRVAAISLAEDAESARAAMLRLTEGQTRTN